MDKVFIHAGAGAASKGSTTGTICSAIKKMEFSDVGELLPTSRSGVERAIEKLVRSGRAIRPIHVLILYEDGIPAEAVEKLKAAGDVIRDLLKNHLPAPSVVTSASLPPVAFATATSKVLSAFRRVASAPKRVADSTSRSSLGPECDDADSDYAHLMKKAILCVEDLSYPRADVYQDYFVKYNADTKLADFSINDTVLQQYYGVINLRFTRKNCPRFKDRWRAVSLGELRGIATIGALIDALAKHVNPPVVNDGGEPA